MTTTKTLTNKIIILGNGFDISHGLKTTFENFMINYLTKLINQFVNSEIKRDQDLMNYYDLESPFMKLQSVKWRDGDPTKNNVIVSEMILKNSFNHLRDFDNFFKNTTIFFRYTPSIFLQSLIKFDKENGWLDFELCYYDLLIDLTKKNDIVGVRGLNKQMFEIKKELIHYLGHINRDIDLLHKMNSQNFFDFKEEYYSSFDIEDLDENQNVLFLNFNYTNTLRIYNFSRIINISFINIHGELKDNIEDVILGYGNEDHIEYQLLERKNNIEYLKNIKSIYYLRKPYYNRLKSFLDSGDYEVKIIGHSCSLSDKVLLNQIFENKSCKKIELHHFTKKEVNSFFNDSINLSKNFNHKLNLRNIVKNFNKYLIIPQSPFDKFDMIKELYVSGG